MIWVFCAALVMASGLFVLSPLFGKEKEMLDPGSSGETELERLQDRKSIIYRNIKDLEFEYRMGRLSDPDFKQHEAEYKSEAAIILQEMEKLGVTEEQDKNLKCPACGAEIMPGKKFCADCGHKL
jgi:hypothetical protein